MRLDHLLSKRKRVGRLDASFVCQGAGRKVPAAMRSGVTPVPIPNTMVKAGAADGTMLETARESRWLPEHFREGL